MRALRSGWGRSGGTLLSPDTLPHAAWLSFASTCRGSGTGLRRGSRLVRWWRQHWIRWSVRPVPGVLSSAVNAVQPTWLVTPPRPLHETTEERRAGKEGYSTFTIWVA